MYQTGCRCNECKRAKSEYESERKHKKSVEAEKVRSQRICVVEGCENLRATSHCRAKYCESCKIIMRNQKNRDRRVKRTCQNCGEELPKNLRKKYCARCFPQVQFERRKLNQLKRYGLTFDDWGLMMMHQDGKCYGCGDSLFSCGSVHVDHDHRCCDGSFSCGICVRGLLCYRCNVGWALLGENLETVFRLHEVRQSAAKRIGLVGVAA
jgi:hypothetical protein